MPLALVSLFFFFFAFNSSSSSSSVCNYRHYLIWTFLNFAIGISFGDLGAENNSTGRSSSSTTLILSTVTTSTSTTTTSTPSPSTQSGHLIVSKCVRTIFLHTYIAISLIPSSSLFSSHTTTFFLRFFFVRSGERLLLLSLLESQIKLPHRSINGFIYKIDKVTGG